MAEIYRLENLSNLCEIGATKYANDVALKKGKIFYFKIKDLNSVATHILKQECLSVGSDFITPRNAILCKEETYSGILIATLSQLIRIIDKCKIQPFGLSNIAKLLESHTKEYSFSPKIMGIINITDDSFYEDSRIKNIDEIILKINNWIEFGVDIVDIGGVSTRPGSEFVDSKEELSRIKDVINELYKLKFMDKITFSIDSYNFDTIRFCLDKGFKIINDVYGLKDENIISLARDYKTHLVLMHNSWIYPHKQDDIILELDSFFNQKLEIIDKYGINDVILDIGFGFGKDKKQNLELIKNLRHFTYFGYEILVGASRKRTIGYITAKDTKDRLSGSLALHQCAIMNGASIIRTHDAIEHVDMIMILKALD